MKKILIPLIIFTSMQTWAYTPRDFRPTYFCPSAHSAYKDALTQLKELKGKLNSLECQDISNEIDRIETEGLLNDREEIVNLVSRNKDGILTGDNAEKLQQYTSKATKTAANIISIARSASGKSWWSSSCGLDENTRFSVISKASSIVYDATQLLSKVSGPYGVPIAIGGSLLSGVLDGVNTFMQNSEYINFEDQNKRLFYAESICLVHQTIIENNRLSEPAEQERIFSTLQDHLSEILFNYDSQCRQDLVNCNTMVTDLLEAYDDATAEQRLTFAKTHEDKIKALNEYSQSINPRQNWGDSIIRSLFDKSWSIKESERFSSILNHHSDGIEKGEVRVLTNKISDFFIDVANKELLRWFIDKEFAKRMMSFRDAVRSIPIKPYSPKVSSQLNLARNSFNPDVVLKELVDKSDLIITDSVTFSSAVTRAYNEWKALEDRYKSYREYCEFFEKSHMIDVEIEEKCDESYHRVARIHKKIGESAFYLAYFIQGEGFRTNSALATFDLSLSRYRKYGDGLRVRKKGALDIGLYYFDDPEAVQEGFEDYYVVNLNPKPQTTNEAPALEAPVIVSEEAAGFHFDISPFSEGFAEQYGYTEEDMEYLLEEYCYTTNLSWEDNFQCEIRKERRSILNLSPGEREVINPILVPN